MGNGYQQAQGFGTQSAQAELQRKMLEEQMGGDQMALAAKLAALPNTDLAYDWLADNGPQGSVVSGHYVAPSWSQHMANAAKMGVGGLMVKRRGDAASEVAKAFDEAMRKKKANTFAVDGLDADPLGI
jgi:hypothetical protein